MALTKSEIKKGNIIISEYMERKFKAWKGNSSFNQECDTYKECEKWIKEHNLPEGYAPELGWGLGVGNYHENWSALMEAVLKIAKQMRYNTDHTLREICGESWSTIEDVFNGAVWYISKKSK